MIRAYPLEWPVGWKRTPSNARTNALFRKVDTVRESRPDGSSYSWQRKQSLTIADGVKRVLESLGRMGIGRDDIVISTNVPVRLDGLPRGDAKRPADPGAAVYWQPKAGAVHRCIAIDQYSYVEDNLAAIAATLEAMRAIERHGGAAILERAFTGFAALSSSTSRNWWEVLEVEPAAGRDKIEDAFRRMAKIYHPDVGGSESAMAELNEARRVALESL